MGDGERRDSQRIDLLGVVHGDVMLFQPTGIRQLGRRGMLVETTFPLQLDSLHDFRLTLGECSIVLKGRVAHSRISEVDQDIVMYRSGIEFVDVSDPVLSTIIEFIETIRQQREKV